MDEERIGLVLARAAELRLKISNCIQKATLLSPDELEKVDGHVFVNGDHENPDGKVVEEDVEDEDFDEEAEKLLNIHRALESLETQLSNLQNLQLQQRYDREVVLAEIEFSRKVLLEKLKDYKGEDLEVIAEASAFAGETVEHDNDLLLPPYPSRIPQSLISDSGYLSQPYYTRKAVQNGVIPGELTKESKKDLGQTGCTTSRKGLGQFICLVAKTVLPLVGGVYVLSMSGIAKNLGKKGTPLKLLSILQQPENEEKRVVVQCPSGRVLLVENGEARCIVKERVEIPFDSVTAKPDINYGSG